MTNPLYDALFAAACRAQRSVPDLPGGGAITGAEFHAMCARAASAMAAAG
jgi:hypothetical protein